ncbi:hypothetical protein ElyMa_004935200 [Elysia marginata]|uniref:Uncharacterized protein n=1 Tax=Elysia marginata TaxID=1093978 RepID=A0AAV4J0N4_9GAST|nr:hypothetical protein ElyMa_004935200 [Elysia marginata]
MRYTEPCLKRVQEKEIKAEKEEEEEEEVVVVVVVVVIVVVVVVVMVVVVVVDEQSLASYNLQDTVRLSSDTARIPNVFCCRAHP